MYIDRRAGGIIWSCTIYNCFKFSYLVLVPEKRKNDASWRWNHLTENLLYKGFVLVIQWHLDTWWLSSSSSGCLRTSCSSILIFPFVSFYD
ncbi:hypothetical protein ACJX0J_022873, partial [Zea mays]